MENALKVQEGKLRKLSIEYNEELYPHLMSVIAERRYVSLMFSSTLFFSSFYRLLTHMLLSSQVVDQPWSAFSSHEHIGVPRSREGFWESCRVRRCAWQGVGCGGAE